MGEASINLLREASKEDLDTIELCVTEENLSELDKLKNLNKTFYSSIPIHLSRLESISSTINRLQKKKEAISDKIAKILEQLEKPSEAIKKISESESHKKKEAIVLKIDSLTSDYENLNLLKDILKDLIHVFKAAENIKELFDKDDFKTVPNIIAGNMSMFSRYDEVLKVHEYPSLKNLIFKTRNDYLCKFEKTIAANLLNLVNKHGLPKKLMKGKSPTDEPELYQYLAMIIRVFDISATFFSQHKRENFQIFNFLFDYLFEEFSYHFCSSCESNKLTRLDWAFNWYLDNTQWINSMIKHYLVPLLKEHNTSNLESVDRIVELIFETFKVKSVFHISKKINIDKRDLILRPEFLTKYIKDIISFESTPLINKIPVKYFLNPHPNTSPIFSSILVKDDVCFDVWIKYIRSISSSKILKSLGDGSAMEFVYRDSNIGSDSKLTISAESIIYILENIKNIYEILDDNTLKCRFILDVQLNLAGLYVTEVNKLFMCFNPSQTFFTDIIFGDNSIEALKTSCRCLESLYYLEGTIKEIECDESTLEILEEMDEDEAFNKTSLKKYTLDKIKSLVDHIFESTLSMKDRIKATISFCFLEDCDNYCNRNWEFRKIFKDINSITCVSASLSSSLEFLKSLIQICFDNLYKRNYQNIFAIIIDEIDKAVYKTIVEKGKCEFDAAGAYQFRLDIKNGLCKIFDDTPLLPKNFTRIFPRLVETSTLLNIDNIYNMNEDVKISSYLDSKLENASNSKKDLIFYKVLSEIKKPQIPEDLSEAFGIYTLGREDISRIVNLRLSSREF